MNMLGTADMLEKARLHGRPGSAVLEALPTYSSLTAKATADKTISRRDFLVLGTALASVAAFGAYSATREPSGLPDATPFPGIRWFPGLGVRSGNQMWEGDASFVQDLYDEFAAPRKSRYFLTTPKYWFIAEKKLTWRDFLVDETKAPSSHAQAQNPDWNNYKWNQNDTIAKMLQAPAIVDNKAKLSIFVAMTATSEPKPVPIWMIRKELTWRDHKKRVHVRQDLEEGWRWMADFLVALVRRYGNNPRVASLVLGEYYPGSWGFPRDFDRDTFRANAKKIWAAVIDNAPKDASGNRLNILQSNPVMTDNIIRPADITELKLGITGSDPYLFAEGCGEPDGSPCEPRSIHRGRQDLYGVVPLQHQCDANLFRSGHEITWTGIRNPFGYTAGQKVPLQLEHVAWYFGSKGVIPLNSMTIKYDPILTDDWFPAFDRFGPNGTDAAEWGQIPNYP